MKYHRNFIFRNDLDNRPISMIVTTLAAKNYDGEQDLVVAFRKYVLELNLKHKKYSIVVFFLILLIQEKILQMHGRDIQREEKILGYG